MGSRSLAYTDILFWNARGIKSKKFEFLNYLEVNNIPIALVNETHLQPTTKFKCPNYITYRSDRLNQRGGGTAILIRQDFKHSEILLPPLKHMEATAIQLNINKESVTLISIYNPPGKIIERDLDLLIGTGNKVILAGDFNAKHVMWNARQNNAAGQTLLKHYYRSDYVISAPSNPTYFPDRNPADADILDFAIFSNVLSSHSIRTQGSLSSSDHNPVLITIRGPLEPGEIKQTFLYREANWELFQNYVVQNLNTQCLEGNCSNSEIDVAVQHLTDVLNKAIRYSIPQKRRTSKSMQISTSTRLLIQKRNRLRTLWQRTHDITLRPLINSLKQEIDSAIKDQISNTWQQTLQRLNTTSMKDTWRITKSLTNTSHQVPPLKHNGNIAITNQEKVNMFADTLEEVFTANPDVDTNFTVSTEQVVTTFLKQPLQVSIRPTNHSEIEWIIRHLKSRKAAGPDGIQNIILKHLPRLVLKFIEKIFNKSLALNYFPAQWKEAKVIMLQKPGKDHTSPLNYRPISLLNSLGKIFERIILKRLNFQLRELQLIRNDQYGFKKGHSTTHTLLRNIERITHGFNNNKATVALFLDIERAFDKVWITGLIAKLIAVKIPPHLIHIIYSYLKNRSFFTMYGSSYSSRRSITAGVPQGSLLGPTLFTVYINDIPSIENDPNVAISIYADDTNISVRSGRLDIAIPKLNNAIRLLEPWFQKWRIKVNTNKCTSTLFSKRLRDYRHNIHPVKIFNENVTLSNTTKYLGVILDSKLTYRAHISSLLRKANCRLKQLFPILNKSSSIDINLALIVYKSLLRSILTYASPSWGYAANTYINKLQMFQNKVLRIITKLPRVTPIKTLHEQTGMPLIKDHIKGIASRLYLKSISSDNRQIRELGQYDPINDKYQRPRSLLSR
jgi:hypothetical protein